MPSQPLDSIALSRSPPAFSSMRNDAHMTRWNLWKRTVHEKGVFGDDLLISSARVIYVYLKVKE
jgi:hypothetical protein